MIGVVVVERKFTTEDAVPLVHSDKVVRCAASPPPLSRHLVTKATSPFLQKLRARTPHYQRLFHKLRVDSALSTQAFLRLNKACQMELLALRGNRGSLPVRHV